MLAFLIAVLLGAMMLAIVALAVYRGLFDDEAV
jgi:hypothetical protein